MPQPVNLLPGLQAALPAIELISACHRPLLSVQNPGASAHYYVQILQSLHGFYAPLDRRIGASYFDFAYRRVASPSVEWLRADLAFYRCTVDESRRCFDLPSTNTLEAILAILFIKETAQLYETRLLQPLQSQLGPEHSFCYLSGWGDQTERHWRNVLQFIHTCGHALDQDAIALHAAQFSEKLLHWLDYSTRLHNGTASATG